jgi:hypothetical protein
VGIAGQKSPHNEEALSLGLLQQALEQDFSSEEKKQILVLEVRKRLSHCN